MAARQQDTPREPRGRPFVTRQPVARVQVPPSTLNANGGRPVTSEESQSVDDVPWGDSPAPRIETSTPKRCKHLGQRLTTMIAEEPERVYATVCAACGHVFDPDKQAKGRRVNRLGKDIERWVGKVLRLTRVGQYGGQEDLGKQDEWAFIQVKSGPQWFLPKMHGEIVALPQRAGRRRALVVVEKPGPGKPRRALFIQLLEEVEVPASARYENNVCNNCGLRWPEHTKECVYGLD